MTDVNNSVEHYKGVKVPSMDSIRLSVDTGEFGFDDRFSCQSDETQKISGKYLDIRLIAALHSNVGENTDEMLERIKTIRAKLDEMGAFFFTMGKKQFV